MLKASVSKTQQNKIMWSVIKLNTETNCLQHWAHPPSILVTQGWGGEEGGEALVSSEVHHVHTVIQEALQRENKKKQKTTTAQSLPFSSMVSAKKMQRRKGPQPSSTMQCHSRFLAPWTLFQSWPICWMCLSPEAVTLVSLYCPDKNVKCFSSASCSPLVNVQRSVKFSK